MADFTKYGFLGVVAKPYEIRELSEVVHRALEKKGAEDEADMTKAATE